jgi:hypothetical protein
MATLAERWQAFRNPGLAVTEQPGKNEVEVGRVVVKRDGQPGARVSLRPRSLAGARARVNADPGGYNPYDALWGVATRPDREVDWRALDLDDRTLDRIDTGDLVQMMADISPEVSAALWYFIRFCNPGWEATALRPGTRTADKAGQARLDEFLARLRQTHGAVDVVWNKLFMTAFLRGAFFAELIADETGRRPLDLAVIDPHAAEYRQMDDPERGAVWQLGQTQDNEWVPLDVPTVSYVPIDPGADGPPYGRSLVTPAVFSALFLLSLLHDLRRVVAQQGYPRLDIEVKLQELAGSMPEEAADDPELQRAWVEGVIEEVAAMYASLQPDDAYVHTDVVQVNRPVGAVDASSLGGVDSLLRAVERMATRGLKTMPLLMGSNEAVSETHANRQWEIHAAGIKALQHLAEQMLERLLTLALQMQGLQAVVEFRFAELRASEAYRDAQTAALVIENAKQKYLNGWINQNEAAMEAVGHPADRPRPRFVDNVGGEDLIDLGDGDTPAAGESTDGEARGRADGRRRPALQEMEDFIIEGIAVGRAETWQRALLREMEAAREGLEKVLDGQ